LQAILCDADLKSLRDLSAYETRGTVGSKLDKRVIKCVKIDECYVLDNVVTQDDDVTLINNAEMIAGNKNDDQI